MKNLKQELNQVNEELNKIKSAIWDMMNYANMFVLVLDENMTIKFINWSLATALGFKTESEPVGKCWLDFIPIEEKQVITTIHKVISTNSKSSKEYQEHRNSILTISGQRLEIKWFNTQINHDYNWSFSIGLIVEKSIEITEDSIRAYYKDIINKDRTMIMALRDSILKTNKCDQSESTS